MLHGFAFPLACGLALILALPANTPKHSRAEPPSLTATEILARSRAVYAALQSYADSGSAVTWRGGVAEERSTFRTYFVRAPRNFFYEYRLIGSEYHRANRLPLNDHRVFWMRRGELQTWDGARGIHNRYSAEGGGQLHALTPDVSEDKATRMGTSTLIASPLFEDAGVVGKADRLFGVATAGIEIVGGRRCHKLTGMAGNPRGRRGFHPSPVTLWIDAETFLIRQEMSLAPYTPPDRYPSIIVYHPRLDPPLHDSLFAFAVASSGRGGAGRP